MCDQLEESGPVFRCGDHEWFILELQRSYELDDMQIQLKEVLTDFEIITGPIDSLGSSGTRLRNLQPQWRPFRSHIFLQSSIKQNACL